MKSILITGASKGLGKELLQLLVADSKYNVISLSRTDPNIDLPSHTFIKTDLSNSTELSSQLEKSKAVFEKLDEILFINNASDIKPVLKSGKFSSEQISKNITINFSSPLIITNFLLGLAKKVDILNVSSGAAKNPIAGWSLYCSTKAASRMFFDTVKLEHPDSKIIQIDPGIIDTAMQEDIRKSDKDDFSRVDEFINFKAENKLKPAREVALTLFNQLLEGQLI